MDCSELATVKGQRAKPQLVRQQTIHSEYHLRSPVSCLKLANSCTVMFDKDPFFGLGSTSPVDSYLEQFDWQ